MTRTPETTLLFKFNSLYPLHQGFARLLSQKDLDQGDTAQRTGTLFALLGLVPTAPAYAPIPILDPLTPAPDYAMSYRLLSPAPGIYRRSANPAFWGSNPNNLSRDQLSVLKLGMLMQGKTWDLFEVFCMQSLRGGFHQNTHRGGDLASDPWKIPDYWNPAELCTYLRGFLGPCSYLLTFLLDSFVFIDLYQRTDSNWDTDNQLALNLLVANAKYPTLWSKLAMRRYLKTNFMSRLWNYHKDEDGNNGCEPLYWLFRLAFLRLYGYEPKDGTP